MSLLQRLAAVGLGRHEEEERTGAAGVPVRRPSGLLNRVPNGFPGGRRRGPIRGRSRFGIRQAILAAGFGSTRPAGVCA